MNEKAELQIDAEQVRKAWRKSLKSLGVGLDSSTTLVKNTINYHRITGLSLVLARANQAGKEVKTSCFEAHFLLQIFI